MKRYAQLLLIFFSNLIPAANALAGNNTSNPLDAYKHILDKLIVILGISTLTSIIITLILGILLKRARKTILPWHQRMAFLTLLLGLSHAVIVLING